MKATQRIVALKAQLKRERQSHLKYKAHMAFILKAQTATLSKLIKAHVDLHAGCQKMMVHLAKMSDANEITIACQFFEEIFKEHQMLIELAKNTHDQLLYHLLTGQWQTPAFTTCAIQDILTQALNENGAYRQHVKQPLTDNFNFIGDRLLAQMMLCLLFDNAVEAIVQAHHGHIEIWIEQDENNHYVHIRDDALGLTNHKDIFKPFYSTKGQTGLGLFVGQEIMCAFHGEISCQRSTDEYAWFSLQFPKMEEHQARKLIGSKRFDTT